MFERLVQYARFRGAGIWIGEEHEKRQGALFRSAPLPASLRHLPLEHTEASYDPVILGRSLGNLLQIPPKPDISHLTAVRVSLTERLDHLRSLLRRGRFLFDEAVEDGDRMTVAVTLFALLELYKCGEADWEQGEPFAPITVKPQLTGQIEYPSASEHEPVAA